LDKIIQLPLDVPIPQEGTLHQFLSEGLNQILYQSNTIFDEERWKEVYHDGIIAIITKPREAIRLVNTVSTAIRGVESEINFVDLVCIEIIRLHTPTVYQNIRNSQDVLTVQATESFNTGSTQDINDLLFSDSESDKLNDIIDITQFLFPNVFNTLSDIMDTDSYREDENYLERNRICDEAKFSIYFRHSIGEAEVTNTIFEQGISATQNPNKLAKFLEHQTEYVGPTGRSRAYNFLSKFSDQYDIHRREDTILIALLKVGDELVRTDPPQNRLDLGSEDLIFKIAGSLIAEKHKTYRMGMCENAFRESASPYIMIGLLKRIDQGATFETDSVKDNDKLLSEDEIDQLAEIASNNIYELATVGTLLDAPHLYEILQWWEAQDQDERCQKWVETLLDKDDGLVDLLRGLVETGQIYSLGKSKKIKYIDPRWLQPFVSPHKALDRINEKDHPDDDVLDLSGWLQDSIRIHEKGGDPQSMRDIENHRFG
jgi:predicted KAP-like P-loop ATPase